MSGGGPERLLDDLNEAQRTAVVLTGGPLAIIAGAGSGKTRVISHRAAYAIETGAVAADRVLLVTYTDKAATEMVGRLAALGHRGVMARTFHANALNQLRHFWPARHDGAPLPAILDSKVRLLGPLAARLPGHYRFTPVQDLATAVEWAKVRRIPPARWAAEGGDRAAVPPDLFARLYADYERARVRAGLIDFEDMLVETVGLLEEDADAAALVQRRKTWFSVDEYQDTNPLAERLLQLWLGRSRDLAVVGDPDQTIYGFTGATPDYLLRFEAHHPGARVVALVDNYRSTPQVLALANRLIGPGPRGAMQPTVPPGPPPTIHRFVDAEAELEALVAAIRERLEAGTEAGEVAVLVRINAQLPPLELALTRAGLPFRVRGQRFFERREVREARRLLGRARLAATGPALGDAVRALLVASLGLGTEGETAGEEARERAASLELILGVIGDAAAADPALTMAEALAELGRRDAAEAAGSANGINLLTYHRAKGLEWEAVFLPALEEGLLPIRQAKGETAVAEERRLLYVGITRARRYLALSWAQRRPGPGGKTTQRQRSRFLAALDSWAPAESRPSISRPAPAVGDGPLLEALRGWRRGRATADAVPAYVVAHDATLAAIAEARPATLAALRHIPGMGPVKLERYGAEILALTTRS